MGAALWLRRGGRAPELDPNLSLWEERHPPPDFELREQSLTLGIWRDRCPLPDLRLRGQSPDLRLGDNR